MNVLYGKTSPLSVFARIPRLALLCAALALSACSGAPSESESETESAETYVPEPNYDQQEGDLYIYVGQVSEEAKARGESKPVVMYRYHGQDADMYRLELVNDDGSPIDFVECSPPCRVAKRTDVAGTVTRVAVEHGSILRAAFQDAANGLLAVASVPARPAITPEVSPLTAPTRAIPESDWRGQRGRCWLLVGGREYISGDCWIRMEGEGSFQIMSLNEQYFAKLSRSGNDGAGFWNETPGSSHAHSALGEMMRSGACWKNDDAEICAWAAR